MTQHNGIDGAGIRSIRTRSSKALGVGRFLQGTARNPDGSELTVNSEYLLKDGTPWLPVMGEFHYTRYPKNEWRSELLKMQVGGIDIIATYVFWIHHEEEQGIWDWSGQRSLRDFAELCGDLGLSLVVRCGPWCHGEVRNGGFPDWLLETGFVLRSNDAGYLSHVQRLYAAIYEQIMGLLWKDGGPVIGIQCENEYGGAAEHLVTLKQIACAVGLDVPLYTRTGWPELSTPMPFGELMPLYGGYADGFWDRSLDTMPSGYRDAFLFLPTRIDSMVGADQLGERAAKDTDDTQQYPYFACEIGGGMETSYHRRIRIESRDIESAALVKIGSGNNLQGYYMYHGGTNPDGKLSTLQESQATNYWNDLPVKSYDFQAPLGEFGQVRDHYHSLRRLHLFLRDFGAVLAPLPAEFPDTTRSASDPLRWSTRTDGASGFLFVNNYERLKVMPAIENVQWDVSSQGATLRIPASPVTVPANTPFFWPFHLNLAGVDLVYATAQPICRIEQADQSVVFFAQTETVAAEFVFDSDTHIEATSGVVTTVDDRIMVRDIQPGLDTAIRIRMTAGRSLCIVLLTPENSLACWKATLLGQERVLLTRASLIVENDTVRLRADDPAALSVAIFPAPESLDLHSAIVRGTPEGVFHRFSVPVSLTVRNNKATAVPIQDAGPLRTVRLGSQGVAEAPTDSDFDAAAVWHIQLPEDTETARDSRLRIRYIGDVARVYLDGKLIGDNFYNGKPFEIGLRRYAPDIYSGELVLQILPLGASAPIYLAEDARPDFSNSDSALLLSGIDLIEQHQAELYHCEEANGLSWERQTPYRKIDDIQSLRLK